MLGDKQSNFWKSSNLVSRKSIEIQEVAIYNLDPHGGVPKTIE